MLPLEEVFDHDSMVLRFFFDVTFRMLFLAIFRRGRYVLFVLVPVDLRVIFLEPDLRFLTYRVRRFLKRGILAGKCWGGVAISAMGDAEIKVET